MIAFSSHSAQGKAIASPSYFKKIFEHGLTLENPTYPNTVRLSLIIFALAPSPPILGGSELKVPQFWGI
jgi:hypothetical protein